MSAILKFVNCFGDVNYGIILDTHEDGMFLVLFDEFAALLARLEKRGKRVNDFVRAGLSVRKSWVRLTPEGTNGATMELLPIDTPVEWSSQELRTQQMVMMRKAEVVTA